MVNSKEYNEYNKSLKRDKTKIAIFNNRRYERGMTHYKDKEEARIRGSLMKMQGYNAIVDKDKNGYFLWLSKSSWIAEKKKPMMKGKKKAPGSLYIIEEQYKKLNNTNKENLIKFVQKHSRLDLSHLKSEDKSTLRNKALEIKFGKKNMKNFDNYLSNKPYNVYFDSREEAKKEGFEYDVTIGEYEDELNKKKKEFNKEGYSLGYVIKKSLIHKGKYDSTYDYDLFKKKMKK